MRNLLFGEKVRLTAVRDSDIKVIEEWFNNAGFLRYYDMIPAVPQTFRQLEALLKYFEDSQERYLFAIRDISTDKIIGITGFDEIIWTNQVATVFIGIGDKTFEGKGLGREAMKLLLDFGYNELNFYRIQLNTIAYNEKAIRLYESLGFLREGTFREFIFRDGQRYDMYLYGMLRPQWYTAAGSILV